MFVVALSVLFSFVCSILSLMLIHDGPVLAPAHSRNMMYFCVIIYAYVYFSWNALVLLFICSYALNVKY